MKKILHINPSNHIYELQQEFNAAYPFLRLDFYLTTQTEPRVVSLAKKPAPASSTLKTAGLKNEGEIDISDTVTVGSLEKFMRDKFGMMVQVLRRSENIWLETTMTDGWTLRQQNEHGREITQGKPQEKNNPTDYDLERNSD